MDDIVDARNINATVTSLQDSHALREKFEKVFWNGTEEKNRPNIFYAYPQNGNTRLSAQSGLFLAQSALESSFMDDLIDAVGCNDAKETTMKITEVYRENMILDVIRCSNIIQFVFPSDMGGRCISVLRAMNVSPKILYPGLEGICKSLSQYLPLIDEQ